MRISGLPGKLLSSVLSASMVIAFAPAVASAAVTPDEQQEGGVNDAAAISEGKYFKATAVDGTATYYKPSEVVNAGEGATLKLLQGYTVDDSNDVATLPANSTLDLGNSSIGAGSQFNDAVLSLAGNVSVNGGSSYNSIASLKAEGQSTVTISGSLHTASNVSASKFVLSDNASLYGQSVVGDIEMGKQSKLEIINSNNKDKDLIGIDGNLIMNEDAEGASAHVAVRSVKTSIGIKNTEPIAVHKGQALEISTNAAVSSVINADTAVSGDLNVENGATVEINTSHGYNDGDNAPSTAVGGNLKAAAGTYWGAIKGKDSSVTGGEYSISPASFVAEGYGTKYSNGRYTVLPKSELSSEITNLYWGPKKGDSSSYKAPNYTINYTSSKNSTGAYEVSFLKEASGGSFESVYKSRSYYDDGGVREINDYSWFHRMLEAIGDDKISGTYKFQVTELDGENIGATATCEATYTFNAPSKKLGVATNLHWNENKPTVACFTLPEDAAGYSVTLYRKGDDENFHPAGGFTSYHSQTKDVEQDFNNNRFQLLTKPGTYKFAVRAISSDLETILDGPESEMSSEFNLGNVTKKVTDGVKADTSTNGKEFLSKEDSSVVGAAMTSDDTARETIKNAEAEYAKTNSVSTSVKSEISEIQTSKVSAIGAAYNAANNTSVELKISKASEDRIKNDLSLKSVIQFSMDLVQTNANNTTTNLGTNGEKLDVPVCVTIPVPDSMKGNLRIRHYTSSGNSYETIWPVVFTGDDGQTYARFYVTHFSDFVLCVEDEGGSDNPGTGGSDTPSGPSGGSTGGSTGGSGSGGGSTIVTPPSTDPSTPGTDEPSNPNEPTTPDTPAADGPEVGTVATVSGITYKVTAADEVEVSKLPAGKTTVTIPAKVKVGGKSCAVTGIASGLLKGSKATTLVIKSKGLTKKSVKNALKDSKVKVVKIKVSGKKSVNKKYVKQYKKIFTKKICGKKVTVK